MKAIPKYYCTFLARVLDDSGKCIAEFLNNEDAEKFVKNDEEIKRLRTVLEEIERFGHGEGHGRGDTCAEMAKKALGYHKVSSDIVKYIVLDCGDPAQYPFCGVAEKSVYDTFEEAFNYAQKWMGEDADIAPRTPNKAIDYSGMGDTIEIREIKEEDVERYFLPKNSLDKKPEMM